MVGSRGQTDRYKSVLEMATIRQKHGFTIVELLIVIVVIAILAAITIVAYNGIQTRANNTQTIDAVKQYIKAYGLYVVDEGELPAATGCLGEGYPAPNNRCLSQDGTAACFSLGSANETGLTAILKPYMGGNAPKPSMQTAACGGTSYVGAYAWYDSASKRVTVVMILKGDASCPSMSPNVVTSGKIFQEDATSCRYTLAAS